MSLRHRLQKKDLQGGIGPCIDPVSRVMMSLRKIYNSDMFSFYSTLARLDVLYQSRLYRYNSIWTRLGRPFPTKYCTSHKAQDTTRGEPFPTRYLWLACRPGAYVIVVGFPSDFVDLEGHFLTKREKNGKRAKSKSRNEFYNLPLDSHDRVVSCPPPCRTVIWPSIQFVYMSMAVIIRYYSVLCGYPPRDSSA
jgi:hypothetical protein